MNLDFLNQFLPTQYQQTEEEKKTPENELEELQKEWLRQQAENYKNELVQGKQALTGIRVVGTVTLSIYIGLFSAITVGLPAAIGLTIVSSVPNFIGVSKRVATLLLAVSTLTVGVADYMATTSANRNAEAQARLELNRFDDETNTQALLLGGVALVLLLGYASKPSKTTTTTKQY